MATKSEKVEKLQVELASMMKMLDKYHKLFLADGKIDNEEMKKLNSMKAAISKVKTKLGTATTKKKPVGAVLTAAKKKEIEAYLAKLEAKFGLK